MSTPRSQDEDEPQSFVSFDVEKSPGSSSRDRDFLKTPRAKPRPGMRFLGRQKTAPLGGEGSTDVVGELPQKRRLNSRSPARHKTYTSTGRYTAEALFEGDIGEDSGDENASSSSDYSDDYYEINVDEDEPRSDDTSAPPRIKATDSASSSKPSKPRVANVEKVARILSCKPAAAQTRGRRDMRAIVAFLQSNACFQRVGLQLCKIAANIMDITTIQANKMLAEPGQQNDRFYIVIGGAAGRVGTPASSKKFVETFAAGDAIGHEGVFNDEVTGDSQNDYYIAMSKLDLAAIPRQRFIEALDRFRRREACLKAAVGIVTNQPSLMRSIAELYAIMNYLRWHPAFEHTTDESLENVARQVTIKTLKPNEVFCAEGSRPEHFLILVRGSISAWRWVCKSATASSKRFKHFARCFTETQKRQICDAIGPVPNGDTGAIQPSHSKRNSVGLLGDEPAEMALTCIDILRGDATVQLVEWALVHGKNCSATLVSHDAVVMLSIPRSLYLQYVRPFRCIPVQNEAALFVIERLPTACRTPLDEHWLLKTPLAQTAVFRALPPRHRGHILSHGKHRRLRKGEWLFQVGAPVKTCFLLLRGCLGFYKPSGDWKHGVEDDRHLITRAKASFLRARTLTAESQAEETAVLPAARPGTVLGEWALHEGQDYDVWPFGIRADADCDLLEVRRERYRAGTRALHQNMVQRVTLTLPLQVLERVAQALNETATGSRTMQHLELLAQFLKTYEEFAPLESHVCLELCQWVYSQSVAAGEALFSAGDEANIFAIVLSGEFGIFLPRESQDSQDMQLLTVPSHGVLGELDSASDRVVAEDDSLLSKCCATAKATKPSEVLVLERKRFARVVSRSHKDIEERDRALIALRYTAPAQRSPKDIALLGKLLSGNAFYGQLEPQVRDEACRAMVWSAFDTFTPIVRQGDEADKCFVVVKGSVGIWINQCLAERSLRRDKTKTGFKETEPAKDKVHKYENNDIAATAATVKAAQELKRRAGKFKKSASKSNLTKAASTVEAKSAAFLTETNFVDSASTANLEAPNEHHGVEHHGLRSPRAASPATAGERRKDAFGSNELRSEDASNDHIDIDMETGGPRGGKMVKVLGQGACFGEAALLRSERRNATIMAREPCECGVIEKQAFNRILREAYMKQLRRVAEFLQRHLPQVSTKSEDDNRTGLSSDDFDHLAGFFSKSTERRGTSLCSVGRPCSRLLIVREGICKVYLRTGLQAPQEIGEVGVGQMIGASTHILGHAAEAYHIACASAQVEVLRMEATDVKTRMPPSLLEAIARVELDRLARLEQRVHNLKALVLHGEALPGMPVQRKAEKEKWLHTPFLCNKQSALLEDVVKISQMQRLWCDWEIPATEGNVSANDSVLRVRYDNVVTEPGAKMLEDAREPATAAPLALPWYGPSATGAANAAVVLDATGTSGSGSPGRSFRSRFVKRGRSPPPWMCSYSSRNPHDGTRPQSAPGGAAVMHRWCKAHEDFLNRGDTDPQEKYLDFISNPVKLVHRKPGERYSGYDDYDGYVKQVFWDTWSDYGDPYRDNSPDSSPATRTHEFNEGDQCHSTSPDGKPCSPAHGGLRKSSAPLDSIEQHSFESSANSLVMEPCPRSSLPERHLSPEDLSKFASPASPEDELCGSGSLSMGSPTDLHGPHMAGQDPQEADASAEASRRSTLRTAEGGLLQKDISEAPGQIQLTMATQSSAPKDSNVQDRASMVVPLHSAAHPQNSVHQHISRLPGALSSKHVKHGSPRPKSPSQRLYSTPKSKQLRPEKLQISVQSHGEETQVELIPMPPSGEKPQSKRSSRVSRPRSSCLVQEIQERSHSVQEALPAKQTWTFVQKYGQLGAQRAMQRSSDRQDALDPKVKSKTPSSLPGVNCKVADEDLAAKARRAEIEAVRRMAGR